MFEMLYTYGTAGVMITFMLVLGGVALISRD